MLEQLVYFDLPAHVRCGIARALGAIGGAQSAEPLMQIVRSAADESLLRYASLSLADIARRHGTSGVAELFRQAYHARPRIQRGVDDVSSGRVGGFGTPGVTDCGAAGISGGEHARAALAALEVEEKDEALETPDRGGSFEPV